MPNFLNYFVIQPGMKGMPFDTTEAAKMFLM